MRRATGRLSRLRVIAARPRVTVPGISIGANSIALTRHVRRARGVNARGLPRAVAAACAAVVLGGGARSKRRLSDRHADRVVIGEPEGFLVAVHPGGIAVRVVGGQALALCARLEKHPRGAFAAR